MAKQNERRLAKELLLQGKNQKEIARMVNVQEKTISQWVKKYGWNEERDARFNSANTQILSLKKLIGRLTEQRLTLIRKMESAIANDDLEEHDALQYKANRLADEVSKYNKALLSIDKENKISLTVYLEVMDSIFKAVQVYNAALYMSLLDFQEQHLSDISLKIG